LRRKKTLKAPISRIDAEKGQLFFRDISAIDLATEYTFEDGVYLLVLGDQPDEQKVRTIKENLVQYRLEAPHLLGEYLRSPPMYCEAPLHKFLDNLADIEYDRGFEIYDLLLFIVAITPIILTASWRLMSSEEPIMPIEGLSHSANVLHMLGRNASQEDIRDFESCLILHMDDPDNPSLSALTQKLENGGTPSEALIAALHRHVDPAHHGAGTEAMKMVLALKDEEDVRSALRERLEDGERIYGLGHRIYRTIDPRAVFLRDLLMKRTMGTELDWLPEKIQSIAFEGASVLKDMKGITVYPNVDLYNAAVYSTFGIDTRFNTFLFAISRVAGWTAHILEWYENHHGL
jgi:citrate synthase